MKKKLNKDDLKKQVNKEESAQALASKTGLAEETVKKETSKYKKGKLNLSYEKQAGDTAPPNISGDGVLGQQEEPKAPVDYDVVARGIVSTIDGLFRMGAMISKGALEYEPLEKEDIDICVNALKQETQVLDFVVKYGLTHATTIFMLLGVFLPRIKLKKKEKKPEKIEEQPSASEQKKQGGLQKVSKPKTSTIVEQPQDAEFINLDEEPVPIPSDYSIIDNSSGELNEVPEKRPANYGDPPKNVKGRVGVIGK